MTAFFRIFSLLVFCLSLANCSLFGGGTEEETQQEETPQYENYHSSGVYNDIEKETRDVSSADYDDDDYGDVDEGDDDEEDSLYLSEGDSEEEKAGPATMADPLPVEKAPKPRAKKKKIKKTAKFKNGMYRVSVNCKMRAKPSAKSKAMGKVRKGKKLWMEAHNKNWVKVFKKSGPVYINKGCL